VERETLVFLARGDLALFDIERRVSEIFRSELDALKDAFDFIIIDCPPGISPITEAALWASDQIIVPTVPDLICNLGLEAFCQTVTLSDAENGAPRRRPWVLANRVRRTRSQINILEEMRSESRSENAGFLMFETEIPDCPDLQEATNWTGERTPYPAKYGQETAAVLDRLVNEM
jgi:cellulose biosynthesis protein BcsQ